MRKKGFTLVEMLAVVIILSLLGLIGIISVESIIRRGSEKSYQAQKNEIKTAAENLTKIEGIPSWCDNKNQCFISLRYLAHKNYIKLNEDGNFLNPKNNEPFSLETVVMLKKYGNNYTFETYDNLEDLNRLGYLNLAKNDIVQASLTIYIARGYVQVGDIVMTSNLVEKDLLPQDFYPETEIYDSNFSA